MDVTAVALSTGEGVDAQLYRAPGEGISDLNARVKNIHFPFLISHFDTRIAGRKMRTGKWTV